MAIATRTVIRVPTQDIQAWIPGDHSISQMQSMYSTQISGLANMVGSEQETTTANGVERVITFTPRAGNKG